MRLTTRSTRLATLLLSTMAACATPPGVPPDPSEPIEPGPTEPMPTEPMPTEPMPVEPGPTEESRVLAGANGAGFFETAGEPGSASWSEVNAALGEIDSPFLLRLPGGAISRFANPVRSDRGWGIVRADVESYYATHAPDGEELADDGLDKWVREADLQPDRSYLDALEQLAGEREVRVIWVLNLFTATPEEAVGAVDQLIERGIDVVGVEAGNEVYSKFESIEEMVAVAQPLFDTIHARHPQLRRSYVGAPLWPRADHERWNADLATYLAAHPGAAEAVTLHPYLAPSRMPDCQAAYDGWVASSPAELTFTEPVPGLDDAFACAREATHTFGSTTIPSWITTARGWYPAQEIWLTEWNVKPVLPFANTWMHGAFAFEAWLALFETEGLTVSATHNGVSPDIFGLLSNARDLDGTDAPLVRRVAFHALALASEAQRGERIRLATDEPMVRAATREGALVRVFVVNDGSESVSIDLSSLGTASRMRVVTGRRLYSSAGHAGPLLEVADPTAGVEIDGAHEVAFEGFVPAHTFGVIEVSR